MPLGERAADYSHYFIYNYNDTTRRRRQGGGGGGGGSAEVEEATVTLV
jgi:hypothetical protein